jgi:hypothetical protein
LSYFSLLGYVLPALAPLAFLLADSFTALKAPSQRIKYVWFSSVAMSAVFGIGVVVWISFHPLASSFYAAQELKNRRTAHEPVFMLNRFFYDVPFYADISEPITVVDDWKSEDVNLKDNWRKEFADAGSFSPEMAALRLINPIQLPAALCQSGVSWILVNSELKDNYAMLNTIPDVFTHKGLTLLRVDAAQPEMSRALNCQAPKMP